EEAGEPLIPLLKDDEERVQFFAAQALGEIGYKPAARPVIGMLKANDGRDVYLRHAGTLALSQIGDTEAILALEESPSRALRIAAVVALRRMEHPGVSRFLDDEDEYIVTEAARAINDDWSIDEALPELAAVLEQDRFSSEPLIRRAINANLRTGGRQATRRLADYAVREGAPDSMRVEAIATLGVWSNPPELDRVTGRYRGQPDLNPDHAREAIASVVDPLLGDANAEIRVAAIKSISNLDYQPAIENVFAHLQDDASPQVRVAALEALQAMQFDQIQEAIRIALEDQNQQVRMSALGLAPTLNLSDDQVAELLSSVLGKGGTDEQQVVLETLGEMQAEPANNVLSEELDKLSAGDYPNELQLDLLMAAEASGADTLMSKLEEYESSKPSDDMGVANPELLYGGDRDAGQRLLFGHEAAQCMRCHAVGGEGATVGPDLAGTGSTLNREQILESLLDPDARIAP